MKKMSSIFVSALAFLSFDLYAANCIYGCPTGISGQIVERSIYTLNNNSTSKFANWAAYHVTPSTIDGPSRTRTWRADPSIGSANTLEPADYDNAAATLGTDRGHQVPLASFSNTAEWQALNYLSNITPQAANLNQGPWERLENAERTYVRSKAKDLYVVTGPLNEHFFGTLPKADEFHIIPSAYFKVVIQVTGTTVKAAAFIMNQSSGRNDNFCGKEVTIDEVELRTGLNIMPSLSSSVQAPVERGLGGLKSELGC
jgi:endonuclease G, mitochondrial